MNSKSKVLRYSESWKISPTVLLRPVFEREKRKKRKNAAKPQYKEVSNV